MHRRDFVHYNLDEQDKKMIARLLRTLLYVVNMLQVKKATLLRLKAMIFGQKSEKMKAETQHSFLAMRSARRGSSTCCC
jgi:hypothetical protein